MGEKFVADCAVRRMGGEKRRKVVKVVDDGAIWEYFLVLRKFVAKKVEDLKNGLYIHQGKP
jgi:hypothetical protein